MTHVVIYEVVEGSPASVKNQNQNINAYWSTPSKLSRGQCDQ